jgi:hypothetical protein
MKLEYLLKLLSEDYKLYGDWVKNFDRVGLFFQGRAAVKKNNKWGYVDERGKIVIPIKYNYAADFDNDEALVVLNKKRKYIGFNGETKKD